MKNKSYKVKLTPLPAHPIWGAKFRCPIDKKTAYVKAGDTEDYFGACRAFMEGDPSIKIPATIDWVNNVVSTAT